MSLNICTRLFVVLAALTFSNSFAQPFLRQPTVITLGAEHSLYKASYALVVGVSAYKTWPTLPQVAQETALVAGALRRQGFEVKYVLNPSGEALQRSFRDFFADFGGDPDNRLLVYYAGHGHTIGEIGYLVGIDAPRPKDDQPTFLKRSQSMSELVTASRAYKARHALYVFDSCFSGAIFSNRADPPSSSFDGDDPAPYLTGPASFPVRQFITAGSETQPVPEVSQFTPLFLQAIEGRIDALNKGGFLSARQLGFWLSTNLSKYTSNQTPRYGTILDSRFDQGDFVFSVPVLPKAASRVEKVTVAPPKSCFVFNGETHCE